MRDIKVMSLDEMRARTAFLLEQTSEEILGNTQMKRPASH